MNPHVRAELKHTREQRNFAVEFTQLKQILIYDTGAVTYNRMCAIRKRTAMTARPPNLSDERTGLFNFVFIDFFSDLSRTMAKIVGIK